MARPFHHDAPDRLQIREGGGCLALFGLPFFAAGVFMILAVAGVIPMSNASEMPRWGWPALAFMALVFTAVGGTFVFGRTWTTLDITRRLVIKQWGLLLPLRERTYPLAGYSAVTLGFVRGDSDTADRFSNRPESPDRLEPSALQLYHVRGLTRVRNRGCPTSSCGCRGFDNRSSRPCHTCRRRAPASSTGPGIRSGRGPGPAGRCSQHGYS